MGKFTIKLQMVGGERDVSGTCLPSHLRISVYVAARLRNAFVPICAESTPTRRE